MPLYKFHLENSSGPSGDVYESELGDDRAVQRAGRAASEVLLSEFVEGRPSPRASVKIERDGVTVAVVTVVATIDRPA